MDSLVLTRSTGLGWSVPHLRRNGASANPVRKSTRMRTGRSTPGHRCARHRIRQRRERALQQRARACALANPASAGVLAQARVLRSVSGCGWAHPCPRLHRDWGSPLPTSAPGLGLTPARIRIGTGLTPAHICTGTGRAGADRLLPSLRDLCAATVHPRPHSHAHKRVRMHARVRACVQICVRVRER